MKIRFGGLFGPSTFESTPTPPPQMWPWPDSEERKFANEFKRRLILSNEENERLRTALVRVKTSLGVPEPNTPESVSNAFYIATNALKEKDGPV